MACRFWECGVAGRVDMPAGAWPFACQAAWHLGPTEVPSRKSTSPLSMSNHKSTVWDPVSNRKRLLGGLCGGADERGHSRSRGEPAGGAGDEGRVEKRWVTLLNWMERERASGWAPGRMWGSGVGVQPGRMGAGGWRLRPGPWWVCLGTLRPLIQ